MGGDFSQCIQQLASKMNWILLVSISLISVTGEPGRRENPVAEGGEVGQRLALGGKIEWGEKWSRALVGDDDFLQRVM